MKKKASLHRITKRRGGAQQKTTKRKGGEKMRKKILLLTMLIATTLVAPVLAKAPTGPAGQSDIIQLLLVEKDDTDWSVVKGGAFGKMTYNNLTGDYVFNGHRLDAETDYTLINFARIGSEWPATIHVLGTGTANRGGNVHIEGTFAYTDLEPDTTPETGDAYKIWLVLSSDINAESKLLGWTPAEYLFEADVI
jgi:hypothetical protein